jgi:hypothetical protein
MESLPILAGFFDALDKLDLPSFSSRSFLLDRSSLPVPPFDPFSFPFPEFPDVSSPRFREGADESDAEDIELLSEERLKSGKMKLITKDQSSKFDLRSLKVSLSTHRPSKSHKSVFFYFLNNKALDEIK